MLIVEKNETIIGSKKPIAVRFTAPWCGPCKVFAPVFDSLESEFPNVNFAKCDVDAYPNIATNFKIKVVPSVLVLKEGNILAEYYGIQSKDTLRKCLKTL